MIRKATRLMCLAATGTAAPVLASAQQALGDRELQVVELENPFGTAQIVVVIGLFAIIIAAMYFASQREKRRQEFLGGFVEKEQAIPKELLPPQPSREREMRRAVWLLSLGFSVGLVLYIATGEWANAAWSLILLCLAGAGFINAALFYPKSDARQHANDAE